MDFKILKSQILPGSVAKRLIFRSFLCFSTISIIPLVHILSNSDFKSFPYAASHNCFRKSTAHGPNPNKLSRSSYLFQGHFLNPVWDSLESTSAYCEENVNVTVSFVKELMGKGFLNYSAKVLCVGDGSGLSVLALKEMGFSDSVGVDLHRFFSIKRKQFAYDLSYKDKTFDFVMSKDFDKVNSVPALSVIEAERVLKNGGIGAVISRVDKLMPKNSTRSANLVSLALRRSSLVHLSYKKSFRMVVFKKEI